MSNRLVLLLVAIFVYSQNYLLSDLNSDGSVRISCYGDSLTEGVGTDSSGYPEFVRSLLKVEVLNFGVSGERSVEIVSRLSSLKDVDSDFVVLMAGANDAWDGLNVEAYKRIIQRGLNISYFYSSLPVLMTNPPQCCGKGQIYAVTSQYNEAVRNLSKINGVSLVDNELLFLKTCRNLEVCELISADGLHLTGSGYRLIAEALSSVLLGLNPLDSNIRRDLAKKLGIEEDNLIIGLSL
ncbi:MAG: SGNH/GDSL hydrolase family protein [Deltaproteobacteria bacterium]|nr:SGNH/GDSL hydrolase family protein [Deltaproteobacteria bacterium]